MSLLIIDIMIFLLFYEYIFYLLKVCINIMFHILISFYDGLLLSIILMYYALNLLIVVILGTLIIIISFNFIN
jgi:hypothetical protein